MNLTTADNLPLALAAAGSGERITLAPGVYTVPTLALAGKNCTIVGAGDSTILRAAPDIAGCVLDFDGYLSPPNMLGARAFGNFVIEGNGIADPALGGIRAHVSPLGGVAFRDIAIRNTGGPCLSLHNVILTEWTNCMFGRPAGADANDVPYLRLTGWCNGNRFLGCGLRSIVATPDGGAVVLLDAENGYTPTQNVFRDCWCEYLHVPDNGAVFSVAGNGNLFDGLLTFDCAGGAESAWYRFRVPVGGPNYGGNEVRGVIPGNGNNAPLIDWGVDCLQSRNRIVGVAGYGGQHVKLMPGCQYTHVDLGGQFSGGPGQGEVIDLSGNHTNTILQWSRGVLQFGEMTALREPGNENRMVTV